MVSCLHNRNLSCKRLDLSNVAPRLSSPDLRFYQELTTRIPCFYSYLFFFKKKKKDKNGSPKKKRNYGLDIDQPSIYSPIRILPETVDGRATYDADCAQNRVT
jgi:hypothetical protein